VKSRSPAPDTMARSVFLRSGDVELCPVETDDAAFLARVVNDPAVRCGIGADTPIALHDEREWIEDGDGTHLLVVADGETVGIVGFEGTEPSSWGVVELGYFLAPDAWGNGYATTAAALVVEHAFRERRCAKVVATVYETNPASARVLEKVGFEREATLRAEAFIEGERVDVHRYGLLADEYDPETVS
jgi:ribosomal-protein-alanine N-acetyltransferase